MNAPRMPDGGLCQQPGVDKSPWTDPDPTKDGPRICLPCPVLRECRAWAAHFNWYGPTIVAAWQPPTNTNKSYGVPPPWRDDPDYPEDVALTHTDALVWRKWNAKLKDPAFREEIAAMSELQRMKCENPTVRVHINATRRQREAEKRKAAS